MEQGRATSYLLLVAIAITMLSQVAACIENSSGTQLCLLAIILVLPNALLPGLNLRERLLRFLVLSSLIVFNYPAGIPKNQPNQIFDQMSAEEAGKEWLAGDYLVQVRGEPRRRYPGELLIEGVVQSGTLKGLTFLLRLADLPWEDSGDIRPGDLLALEARARWRQRIDSAQKLFSYDAYLQRRNISAVGTGKNVRVILHQGAASSTQARFIQDTIRRFGERDSLLVAFGSTIGEGDLLAAETFQLFRDTGTTHLIVVSGFHVGIVFGIFYRICFLLLVWGTRLPHFIAVQRLAAALALPAAAGYTSLAGAEPTAVRALLVVAIYALAKITGREVRAGRTLLLAFLAVILIWPGYQFEASCHLTFAALLGLHCGCSCLAQYSTEKCWRRNWLVKSVILSTFANLYTMPVVLGWFKTIVPLSCAINVIAIPLFSAVFIVGSGLGLLSQFLTLPGSNFILSTVLDAGDLFLLLLSMAAQGAADLRLGVERIPDVAALCITAVCSVILIPLSVFTLTIKKKSVSS